MEVIQIVVQVVVTTSLHTLVQVVVQTSQHALVRVVVQAREKANKAKKSQQIDGTTPERLRKSGK